MKKIIGLLTAVLLITAGIFYTQSIAFKLWYIEEIRVEDEILTLRDAEKEEIISSFTKEKAQDYIEVQGEIKTVSLSPRVGKEKLYDFYFDLDFGNIKVFDRTKEVYYQLQGDIVKTLYMKEDFLNIYTYLEPKGHNLSRDGQGFDTKAIYTLRYTKADGIWHENILDNNVEETYFIVEDKLDLVLDHESPADEVRLQVYQKNNLIYSEENFEGIYIPEEKGVYDYVIRSFYSGPYHSSHFDSYFKVEVKKTPEFTMSGETFEQGQSLVLVGKNIESEDELFLENNYWDALKFKAQGDEFVLVIPSGYYTTPGKYKITCGTADKTFEFDFELLARNFETQNLTVSATTTNTTQTSEASDEFNKYYYDALKKDVYEAEVYDFNGEFMLPASGRVTTEFGVYRYVNGKKTSYRHSGVDIAAPIDTPIMATYDGEVVLSRFLIKTGNTIVISHGHGIFSTYFHMNSLDVQSGDLVEKGMQIGHMGTTGFSTGSHLHFGVSYFTMNLEPGHFIYQQAITYTNYKTLFELK